MIPRFFAWISRCQKVTKIIIAVSFQWMLNFFWTCLIAYSQNIQMELYNPEYMYLLLEKHLFTVYHAHLYLLIVSSHLSKMKSQFSVRTGYQINIATLNWCAAQEKVWPGKLDTHSLCICKTVVYAWKTVITLCPEDT